MIFLLLALFLQKNPSNNEPINWHAMDRVLKPALHLTHYACILSNSTHFQQKGPQTMMQCMFKNQSITSWVSNIGS
jgi:hypothetical protein